MEAKGSLLVVVGVVLEIVDDVIQQNASRVEAWCFVLKLLSDWEGKKREHFLHYTLRFTMCT